MMPKAYFVVRATVADASQRKKFDHWYSTDHMPWAIKEFKAEKAWRFWSETDPSVHQATDQFADMAQLDAAMKSAGLKALVADFDRAFPAVTRAREILTLAEEQSGA
jgi:hypothetical protein